VMPRWGVQGAKNPLIQSNQSERVESSRLIHHKQHNYTNY
jgi:hypothetical protein